MTALSVSKLRHVLPATLIIAGLGLAVATSATATPSTTSDAAPLACDIAVEQNGRMVSFQGRVQASEDLSGTYSLMLSGGGTSIRQGGAFSADAGDIVTLGQANLSGTPSRYDVELTLSVGGTTYNCATNL
jgi:CsgH protein